MTRNELTRTGLTIGREQYDKTGNLFIRLDSNGNSTVVVRDQKDGQFFIIGVYTKEKANRFLDRVTINR